MAKTELTYESALAELKSILHRLEDEEVNIDQIALDVRRSAELIKFCKDKLHKTEVEVNDILKDMKE